MTFWLIVMTTIFAGVIGFTWGGLMYLYNQELGIIVGFSLFILAVYAIYMLMGMGVEPEETETKKRRRTDE